MKKFLPVFISLFLSISAGAQLISHFTWETNSASKSEFGPNAVSVSNYATISAGGANGSNGLNPGNGQYDINLVLNGASFNLPAIDISIDYRREESVASFFYRGSNFDFGMNGGKLSVNFALTSGTGFTAINSGNIYTIPDDHHFHNYHFIYDNNTGIARVLVDAAVVYTYSGTTGLPLYWTGAGNVTIGKDMDATGKNVAVLDNLIVQEYATALLPVQLLSFTASAKNKYAAIDFTTTQEINIASFIIEKSGNGSSFSPVKTVNASNGYSSINHYQYTDSVPFSPVCYYRLKMINSDGSFSYSAVKSVNYIADTKTEIDIYPNPATDYIIIKMNNAAAGRYHYSIAAITGQVITSNTIQLNAGLQEIKIDFTKTGLHGMVIIRIDNTQTGAAETFSVIRK
jgi:hypothetical protein